MAWVYHHTHEAGLRGSGVGNERALLDTFFFFGGAGGWGKRRGGIKGSEGIFG